MLNTTQDLGEGEGEGERESLREREREYKFILTPLGRKGRKLCKREIETRRIQIHPVGVG